MFLHAFTDFCYRLSFQECAQSWNTESISLRCRIKDCLEMTSSSRIKGGQVCPQPIINNKSCLSYYIWPWGYFPVQNSYWPYYVACRYWMSSGSKTDLSYWSYEKKNKIMMNDISLRFMSIFWEFNTWGLCGLLN